jgi:hypothetical protein
MDKDPKSQSHTFIHADLLHAGKRALLDSEQIVALCISKGKIPPASLLQLRVLLRMAGRKLEQTMRDA